MSEPRYSIVIPVYNAEKYLYRCLDSILQQTFSDYEIIIVDDGSTDASKEICSSYVNDYRVFYYSQTNSGVSSARNKALREAKGEYILFVDADDYISANLLENIEAHNTGQDVIVFQFSVDSYGSKTKIKQDLGRFVNDPLDFTVFYKNSEGTTSNGIFHDNSMAVYCWRAVYKRQFLEKNSIVFNEVLRAGEDRIFLYNVLLNSPVISVVDDEFGYYHSIHGTDSLIGNKDSQKYKPTLFQDQLNMYEAEMQALEKNTQLSLSDIENIKQYRANRIRASVIINEFKYNRNNAAENIKSYFENELFQYSYGFKSFIFVLKQGSIREIVRFLMVRFHCYSLLPKTYRSD